MAKSNRNSNQLKALVSDVNTNTSVHATVMNGAVVIYAPSGEVFAEVSRLVKQTDEKTNTIAIIAGVAVLITIAGVALVVKQVKSN